jgi:hypothetical protein
MLSELRPMPHVNRGQGCCGVQLCMQGLGYAKSSS